jgi:hypothetical protein
MDHQQGFSALKKAPEHKIDLKRLDIMSYCRTSYQRPSAFTKRWQCLQPLQNADAGLEASSLTQLNFGSKGKVCGHIESTFYSITIQFNVLIEICHIYRSTSGYTTLRAKHAVWFSGNKILMLWLDVARESATYSCPWANTGDDR